MYRRSVDPGEAGVDLHHAGNLVRPERPHAYHERPAERSRGPRRAVRAVHGNVAAGAQVAHLETRGEEWRLERERAADEEADQIAAPDRPQIAKLADQLAFLEDAVPRQIGAQIGARRAIGLVLARVQHLEERTRTGIANAVEQEVRRL